MAVVAACSGGSETATPVSRLESTTTSTTEVELPAPSDRVPDSGLLVSLAVDSGHPRWATDLPPGLPGHPAVLGDQVVVALLPSCASDAGVLTALSSDGGGELWQVPIEQAGGVRELGRRLARGDASTVVATQAGAFTGIDLATGETRWRVEEPATHPDLVSAAPVHTEELSIHAVDRSGPDEAQRTALRVLGRGTGEERTSVALPDGQQPIVIAGGDETTLFAMSFGDNGTGDEQSARAYDLADGTQRWEHRFGFWGFIGFPGLEAAGDHVVAYLRDEGGTAPDSEQPAAAIVLDGATGAEKHRIPLPGTGIPRFQDAATLYFVDGVKLNAVDLATGTTRFAVDAPSGTLIAQTSVAASDDVVVVASADTLVAYDTSDGTPRWEQTFDQLIGDPYGLTVTSDAVVVIDGGRVEGCDEP